MFTTIHWAQRTQAKASYVYTDALVYRHTKFCLESVCTVTLHGPLLQMLLCQRSTVPPRTTLADRVALASDGREPAQLTSDGRGRNLGAFAVLHHRLPRRER